MPNEFLEVLMEFYSKKSRYDVLQKLILSLDLTALDISPLIVMCMEHDLFVALIYISTKSGDFLTPLFRLLLKFEEPTAKRESRRKFGLKVLW